jgi:hypothetical protein
MPALGHATAPTAPVGGCRHRRHRQARQATETTSKAHILENPLTPLFYFLNRSRGVHPALDMLRLQPPSRWRWPLMIR